MAAETADIERPKMFVIGRDYSRRADIHGPFGGQTQGGISTPADKPFVFLFTGQTGGQYEPEDGWRDEDVLVYTGERQYHTASYREIVDIVAGDAEDRLFTQSYRAMFRPWRGQKQLY